MRSTPLWGRLLPALGTLLLVLPQAQAQLPTTRLFSVYPPGGKQGTTVEVTLTGSDFEEVRQLYFDHPGITAEPIIEMKDGKPVPIPAAGPAKFKVTIAADTPLGLHDVRAIGQFGISNPRTFVVGDRIELNETEPNNTPDQAVRVLADKVPSLTVNGQINGGTDVDHFVFSARAGQRVLVDCQSQRIDSRLNARLVVYGPKGKLIDSNDDFRERDPFLDVTIPADGDYTVALLDQVYDGSPEYFYRLTIGTFPYIDYVFPPAGAIGTAGQFTLYGRNLPGSQPAAGHAVDGRPLEQLNVQITVPADPLAAQRLSYSGMIIPRESTADAFEYRLTTPQGSSNPVRIGIASLPLVGGTEPNDSPETAQAVSAPCEVFGQFQSPGDTDWYSFTAKANEVWVFEVFSQRAGFPTDAFLLLRRASDGAEIANSDDEPNSPIGLRFDTRSDDAIVQSPALAEGQYQVAVRDLYGAARGSSHLLYRLRIRRPEPDFRLVAMHQTPAIPNAANPPDSLVVRQGGNQHLDVYAIRRDGFAGEITIQAEGLPPGVTCPPVIMGPTQNLVPLVFTAADNAAAGIGAIKVTGTSIVNGQAVAREARPGFVTWQFDPNQQIRAQSRLGRSLVLAVREGAPYRVVTTPDKVTIARGLPLKMKLQLTRRGDFKDQIIGLTCPPGLLPPGVQNPTVNIGGGQNEVEVTMNLPANLPVGNYTFALRGNAPAVPFTKDPEGKNKQNVQVGDISTPIQVTVTDPLSMTAKPAPATVKKGATTELVVTVSRLGGYTGPVQAQVVQLPANVTCPAVTIAPEAAEGKLVITAAANAAPGNFTNLLVRATVQVGGQNVNIDTSLTLAVVE